MRRWQRSYLYGLSPVVRRLLFIVSVLLVSSIALFILYSLPDVTVGAVDGGKEVWATTLQDRPVSNEELSACTRRWLQTDGVPADTIIPFAIVPVTLEWLDFCMFMCRVHARVRYLYILQNGAVEEMTALLTKLRSAVPSERLIIEYRPQNIGYAAAVNEGYRMALQKAHAEVPFIGVFNCDVYFERRYFDGYIPVVYKMLAPDAARIRALEEEVQNEEKAALAVGRRTLRASAATMPGLSISMLLSDRVRYASFAEQQNEFKGHIGMFYYENKSMCAFLVSRLALLVGGFLDENFYPAYFEDYDWQFRLENLGFGKFTGASTQFGSFFHRVGGNIRAIDNGPTNRSTSYDMEAMRVERMLNAKPGVDYGETKWAWHREAHIAMTTTSFPQLRFIVPLDVWVLDTARHQLIIDIGTGRQPSVEMSNTYNLSLLSSLRPFAPTDGKDYWGSGITVEPD
ncbi:beta galactofuranosyl glycosyle transferase [Leishmania tarentolae]|uniref:Beta galactofuranosyl glycosyle transferase n=1 Tax=Leishmania tarentolae TaxID=5689 RepID=A0A640KR59_LEITA|nr:beta galactofuranosyl glycosyle transferase [Leishmania tarentolae]